MNEDQLAAKGAELAGQAEAGLSDAGVLVGELSGQIAKSATGQLKDAVKVVSEVQYDITGAILGDLVEAGEDLTALQTKISGRVDGKAAELSAVASGLPIPGPAVTAMTDPALNSNTHAGENALDSPVPPNVSPGACGSGQTTAGTTPAGQQSDASPAAPKPPSPEPGTATEPPKSNGKYGEKKKCPNCFTICGPTEECPCGKITSGTAPPEKVPDKKPKPVSSVPGTGTPTPPKPGEEPDDARPPDLITGDMGLRCAVDAWVNLKYESSAPGSRGLPPLEEMLGIVKTEDGYKFTGKQPDDFITRQAYKTTANALGTVISSAETLIKSLVGASGCNETAYYPAMAERVVLGFLAQWISPELKELSQLQEYYTHALCPRLFPDVEQATQAFLGGTISPEVFLSWIRINDHCPEPWEKVAQAIRTKLDPQELMALRLRKAIDEDGYKQRMRQLGYLSETDMDMAFSLSEQVPPVQELMRFMVRDVADEKVGGIVQKFNLDADFDNKWRGRVKEWGKFQGITDEYAKDTWRAHWIIPGPTQLFEMYHRLRNDKDIKNKRVDEETVKTALQQQDILPFWIDRLLAVSFRPLTRIDIRRAFDIGSIDKEAVFDANIQLGYSDENAETLTKFAEDQRNARIPTRPPVRQWVAEAINRKECTSRLAADRYKAEAIEKALDDAEARLRNSTPIKLYARFRIDRVEAMDQLSELGIRDKTIDKWLDSHLSNVDSHPAIKKYERGIISEEDLRTALFNYGADAEKLQEILKESNHVIELDFNRDCIKAIETRFMLGEITDEQVLQELRNIKITNKFANQHLRAFQCKRSVSGKMPSTEKLCQWFSEGIIGADEYFRRLQNIGWSAEDAATIHLQCSVRLGAKQQRAADKRAKEQKAQQDRAKRELQRQEKQIERNKSDREKSIQKGLKTKDRRDKAIIKAVEAMVKKTGQDLPSAFSEVKSLVRGSELGFVINRDDAIASVAKAIASPKYPEEESLKTLAFEFAASFAKLDASGVATNGKPF